MRERSCPPLHGRRRVGADAGFGFSQLQSSSAWARGASGIGAVAGFGMLAGVAVAALEAFGWNVPMVSPPSLVELAYLAGASWLVR